MFERVFRHHAMLGDPIRMEAFSRAIRTSVRPGDVVVDIGTGSGILAFLAARAGARKVYAIELEEIVFEAKKLAVYNGLAEQVVFLQGFSDRLDLPEPVDVIVSETLGSFGLDECAARFLSDAKTRFLKPGGILIPEWVDLYVVPVEAPEIWNEQVGLWTESIQGVDYSPVLADATSRRRIVPCIGRAGSLADPSLLGRTVLGDEGSPSSWRIRTSLRRDGVLHGWVGYFRSGLTRDVMLSTGLEDPKTHWHQTFFPLPDRVAVRENDRLEGSFKAIPDRTSMAWEWNTKLEHDGMITANYSQCDFHFSKAETMVGRGSHKPRLTQQGDFRRQVLSLCDGNHSMDEIAAAVLASFPDQYRDRQDAMREVIEVVRPNLDAEG
jgi:predicted RNA methylase